MLASLCHFEVGVVLEALLDEVDMGRVALACHFSLDVLSDKTSSLPVVYDHVSVRNWPPLLPLHVVTEGANDSALEAEIEPELMKAQAADRMWYVMDGSPWSFISPFLDLSDTFNMRTTATSWNTAAKYPCGELLFFLLHKEPHEDMAPGHSVGGNVQEVAHTVRQEYLVGTWPECDEAVYHSAVWGKPPGVDGSTWWLP